MGLSGNLMAQTKIAPPAVATSLLLRLLEFNKNIEEGDEITICVLGDPEMAEALEANIGTNIGKGKLKKVIDTDKFPRKNPDVLFIGDSTLVDEAIEFTWAEKVLGVTRIPDLVTKGVMLGFGIGEDLNFETLLNTISSKLAGIEWDQTILNSATIIE
jgi:hypothetical protein